MPIEAYDDAWIALEASSIRRELAALRQDMALLQCGARWRKAFNPNQPRVPAGNSDGGQWTSEGAAGGRLRLAGPKPGPGHNQGPPRDELPQLPKERPAVRETRSAAIKDAARRLARFGGPIGKIIGAAIWLHEYDTLIEASLDPPKSLEDLQRAAVIPATGYQRHHIAEQDAAERDGYPRMLIDGPDNVVLIPT
jgi:hypothetical protein